MIQYFGGEQHVSQQENYPKKSVWLCDHISSSKGCDPWSLAAMLGVILTTLIYLYGDLSK